jgi:hypothetical protein
MSMWVSMFANVGVFLGFLGVAYQLHLNTLGLAAASEHSASQLSSNTEIALMGDTGYAAVAKAMLRPHELNHEEVVQTWAYFSLAQMSAARSFDDYREGRVSEGNWLVAREVFISYINFPFGRIWWNAAKPSYSDSRTTAFFDAVQQGLDQVPENLTQQWLIEMHREAGKLQSAID